MSSARVWGSCVRACIGTLRVLRRARCWLRDAGAVHIHGGCWRSAFSLVTQISSNLSLVSARPVEPLYEGLRPRHTARSHMYMILSVPNAPIGVSVKIDDGSWHFLQGTLGGGPDGKGAAASGTLLLPRLSRRPKDPVHGEHGERVPLLCTDARLADRHVRTARRRIGLWRRRCKRQQPASQRLRHLRLSWIGRRQRPGKRRRYGRRVGQWRRLGLRPRVRQRFLGEHRSARTPGRAPAARPVPRSPTRWTRRPPRRAATPPCPAT